LAGKPKALPENPIISGALGDDVLSSVLATIRLSGSLQFCFVSSGAWQTDATPALGKLAPGGSSAMPFHIVVEGHCWMKMGGQGAELEAGDIVVFPHNTGHQLGAGEGGRLVLPTRDLPQKPWRAIPVLRYGDKAKRVRLLCGYLECGAMSFAPVRLALPKLIHVRTRGANDGDWLRASIRQMTAEVDEPRPGGVSMLPRLTEIVFIEILRHQITMVPGSAGWLAALADPLLSRCLALIHQDSRRDWSVEDLAAASGASRSTLAARFQSTLETSPIRYLRDWRLHLASVTLSTSGTSIAAVAHDAGYATEAAFNRAFSRTYGVPPAAWRDGSRERAAL
jgi:AraC-like DNA-binding protein